MCRILYILVNYHLWGVPTVYFVSTSPDQDVWQQKENKQIKTAAVTTCSANICAFQLAQSQREENCSVTLQISAENHIWGA